MILHINSKNERKLSRRNYIQLGSMQLSKTFGSLFLEVNCMKNKIKLRIQVQNEY